LIQLNSNEIVISSASIKIGDQFFESVSIEHVKEKEVANISFPKELVGDAELTLTFTGILNDQMAGFYRSEYVDLKGEKKFMAATQFEATDARRAFPCWDEPSRKATFKVLFYFILFYFDFFSNLFFFNQDFSCHSN